MNDAIERQQLFMARYMAAVAKVLGGPGVDHDAFIDRVELIVGGSAVNMPTLLAWGARVRRTGLPMLLLSQTIEPSVPLISLVAQIEGRTHVIESCALWMSRHDDRARLVPENMQHGAFVFDDQLNLRRLKRAPAATLEAAAAGMGRAYNRLLALELALHEQGTSFELPSLHRLAA